jgi:hypothetical protein
MAEILGIGVTHYPPLCGHDEWFGQVVSWALADPGIPAAQKDPANWPARMREEWGDDKGEKAAARHRAAMVAGFEQVRRTLDDFAPDVVLIWGDDQYENFKADVVPAFTVCAYEDMEVRPWAEAAESTSMAGRANIWDEPVDMTFRVRGRPDIAKGLATALLESGIDIAYAYRPLHHPNLGHAFLNAILYLDYHRTGFDYPVIAFPINCYGRRVIAQRAFAAPFGQDVDFDPPSPSPRRCMEVGARTAEILRDGPWRVALVASSGWSHAFLCDKTYRLRPDIESDRVLYDSMVANDFEAWRTTTLAAIEDAGEQEMLNWFALMGAMETLGAELDWSEWIETDIYNSNKVFATYRPV